MPYQFVFYPDPPSATFILKPDAGGQFQSVPYKNPPDGRDGQVTVVPDTVPDQQGCLLEINQSGYKPWSARGFLVLFSNAPTPYARLQIDDVKLEPTGESGGGESGGETDPNQNPLDIINHVYNSTHPNLATHAGCGKFTEDCVTELHNKMHPAFGHIKKEPAQNQFNGHAVDALMLLVPSGGTAPGIYDIIISSVSSSAKPAFNYAGPPENEKWYYPAAPITSAAMASAEKQDAATRKGKK